MIEIKRILKVAPIGGHVLKCEMENGEVYDYDMSSLVHGPGSMILPLRESYFFEQVFLSKFGHLAWPNGYEIHANTVVRDGSLSGTISKKTA